MNRVAMSPAASALLRALIRRADVSHDRILLTDVRSVEWQSLTFSGERHQIQLRVPPPQSLSVVERICDGLDEAEFSIPGFIVADIGLASPPQRRSGGFMDLAIEALTIIDD
jgi:hypothetical protein